MPNFRPVRQVFTDTELRAKGYLEALQTQGQQFGWLTAVTSAADSSPGMRTTWPFDLCLEDGLRQPKGANARDFKSLACNLHELRPRWISFLHICVIFLWIYE